MMKLLLWALTMHELLQLKSVSIAFSSMESRFTKSNLESKKIVVVYSSKLARLLVFGKDKFDRPTLLSFASLLRFTHSFHFVRVG